ncbi:hypothetical protein C8R45DRAFT_920338 [Mycena sanguinolenta]|nr:hypothetical protein C8R45DRAFT_920338 [Mycena sanguinolenta]
MYIFELSESSKKCYPGPGLAGRAWPENLQAQALSPHKPAVGPGLARPKRAGLGGLEGLRPGPGHHYSLRARYTKLANRLQHPTPCDAVVVVLLHDSTVGCGQGRGVAAVTGKSTVACGADAQAVCVADAYFYFPQNRLACVLVFVPIDEETQGRTPNVIGRTSSGADAERSVAEIVGGGGNRTRAAAALNDLGRMQESAAGRMLALCRTDVL